MGQTKNVTFLKFGKTFTKKMRNRNRGRTDKRNGQNPTVLQIMLKKTKKCKAPSRTQSFFIFFRIIFHIFTEKHENSLSLFLRKINSHDQHDFANTHRKTVVRKTSEK